MKVILFDLFDTLLNKEWFDYEKALDFLASECFDGQRAKLADHAKAYRCEYMMNRNETNLEVSFTDQLQYYERCFQKQIAESYQEIEWRAFSVCRSEHLAEGAVELLAYLKSLGYRMAVLSNSIFSAVTLKRYMQKYGILEFFENVYSSADITFRKPSKKAFEYVLADMSLSPSKNIHFIGNKKEKDVDGALATGLTPILVEQSSDFDGLAFRNLREVKDYFEENYVYINSISENESLVDGPGLRTVVYFQGCTRACPGCHNPSTWSLSCGKRFSLDELIQTLENKAKNKKVTLSGGDPLLQSKALLKLLRRMQEYDVCLYTGGEENDVPEELKKLLRYLKVGPYEKSKRTTTTPFVGSTNQVLIDLRRKNEAINK